MAADAATSAGAATAAAAAAPVAAAAAPVAAPAAPVPTRVRPRVQEARISQRVEGLERDTGVKLRVLAQNYPETPGAVQAGSRTPCPHKPAKHNLLRPSRGSPSCLPACLQLSPGLAPPTPWLISISLSQVWPSGTTGAWMPTQSCLLLTPTLATS